MGLIGAKKVSQTMNDQIRKADDLLELTQKIIDKIADVDAEIELLVKGGIQGETVERMSTAYMKNREVINDIVQRFSLTASVIRQNAELTQEKQQEALDAIKLN